MRINEKMSILFFLWKTRIDEDGKAPIYCRITIGGKRAQISTNQKILAKNWCQQIEGPRGNSDEAVESRRIIAGLRVELQRIFEQQLILENECSSAKIIEIFKGNLKIVEKKPVEKTLCQAFDFHNKKFSLLVDKGKRSKATLNIE